MISVVPNSSNFEFSRTAWEAHANLPPVERLRSIRADLRAALRRHFGFNEFNPGQEDVTRCLLSDADILYTQSTGAGKSLPVQLDALVRQDGFTIFVSPLIALMRDQVQGLAANRIPAAAIHSLITEQERDAVYACIRSGTLRMVYVSPERLTTKEFHDGIGGRKVTRLAVDEAHCVSMWGHDFRPQYQSIPRARGSLGNPPIAALTATAPPGVRRDIIEMLRMQGAVELHGNLDRPELSFHRRIFKSNAERQAELVSLVQDAVSRRRPILIYCAQIRTVEELSQLLLGRGIRTEKYFGRGMNDADRNGSQDRFVSGESLVMLATKAFGMGVDKRDVRTTVFFELPASIEDCFQGAGRTSRDGEHGDVYLFFTPFDVTVQRSFSNSANPLPGYIRTQFTRLYSRAETRAGEALPSRSSYLQGLMPSQMYADPRAQALFVASLGMLEMFGLIYTERGRIYFLRRPDEFTDQTFPITPEICQRKYDLGRRSLQGIMYIATDTDRDVRQTLLEHMRHDTVLDRAAGTDPLILVGNNIAHRTAILGALAEGDLEMSDLTKHLAGERKSAICGFGGLSNLRDGYERRLEVDMLEEIGLIRRVRVGTKTIVSITEAGLARLEAEDDVAIRALQLAGVGLRTISSTTELKNRMHHPAGKSVLREALGDWWRSAKRHMENPREKRLQLEAFRAEDFSILGDRLNGESLVRDFIGLKSRGKVPSEEDCERVFRYLFPEDFVSRSALAEPAEAEGLADGD